MLTQDRLKEIFYYNPETGDFIRKISTSPNARVGCVVAHQNKRGYVTICVNNKRHFAHRLAWLYVYGVWPANEIDHKDTIRHHNWIDNLRDVTKSGNQQNQVKAHVTNKTGFLGVCFAGGKYNSEIRVFGKKKHLGCFDTAEEAHAAYIEAKRILHSTCTI